MQGRVFQNGFTLFEITIVVAVLVILGSIIFVSFARFRERSQLDTTVREILAALRLAQSKTLASEGNYTYGVHFQSDRIVLFRGTSYDSATTTNETTRITTSVSISTALTGGGADIIFDRITGATAESGTITLTSSNASRIVTIDAAGEVRAEAASLTPSGTRFTDTRHVNFALGWNIQNATTLKLTFSNPPNANTVSSIAMTGYFNADKSSFDWSGTVNVNGSNQVLRIHTIAVSPNTTLSVYRDRRTNDKALTISIIDGGIEKGIATYTATGTTTVGTYGGTMTVQ